MQKTTKGDKCMVGEDKVRILVTVPKEMKAELDKIAEEETRNTSNLIVSILKDYLNNKTKGE
jgi:metal-responsive CopG/Arc/MetJ family transcriptional regulator